MDDLISRQAVIEMLDETRRIAERNIDGAVLMTFEKVLDSLVNITNALPNIQPEIVRCKDCKHWIPYDWMFSEMWQSKNIADYPEDEIGCDCCDMAQMIQQLNMQAKAYFLDTDTIEAIEYYNSLKREIAREGVQAYCPYSFAIN